MKNRKVIDILYKIFIKFQLLLVLLLVLDLVTKLIAVDKLSDHTIYIFNWFQLKLQINDGVAFSFLSSLPSWIHAMVSVVAFVAIEYFVIIKKPKEKLFTLLLLIIAAGAIGNGIDRILATFGKTYVVGGNEYKGVVDFIYVTWFANFNVADIYVTLGIIALMIYFFFSKDDTELTRKEKRQLEEENKLKEAMLDENIENLEEETEDTEQNE